MNKIIFEQLKSCKVANIGKIDENTTHISIPKTIQQKQLSIFDTSPDNPIQVGKCCVIKLEKYIINPPPNFTLAADWNQGTVPPGEYMIVRFLKVLPKMVQFEGYLFDYLNNKTLTPYWIGWVPIKSMSVITEVKQGV